MIQYLLAPINRWHLASPGHKVISLLAGAGVSYYVHTRKGWEPFKVAAAGLGTAYGVSLVLHTVSSGVLASLLQPTMLQPAQPMGMAPQALGAAQPQAIPAPQAKAAPVVDMRTRQPVAAAK